MRSQTNKKVKMFFRAAQTNQGIRIKSLKVFDLFQSFLVICYSLYINHVGFYYIFGFMKQSIVLTKYAQSLTEQI